MHAEVSSPLQKPLRLINRKVMQFTADYIAYQGMPMDILSRTAKLPGPARAVETDRELGRRVTTTSGAHVCNLISDSSEA